MVGNYGKTIAGGALSTTLVILAALTDRGISPAEWVGIVGTLVLSGLGFVRQLRNRPAGVLAYLEAIRVGVTAAVGILGTSLADGGLSVAELTTLVVGVAGALGVTAGVSNAPASVPSNAPRHAVGTIEPTG